MFFLFYIKKGIKWSNFQQVREADKSFIGFANVLIKMKKVCLFCVFLLKIISTVSIKKHHFAFFSFCHNVHILKKTKIKHLNIQRYMYFKCFETQNTS